MCQSHDLFISATKPWINLHKLNSSIDSEKDDNISTAWARIKTVSVNVANKRSKRSENFYWSNENIRKAQPHMPILNYVPNPVEVSSKCATNHAGDLPVYAADVTSYPFSTFGRLLHRVNGELHWCTAAFVHSNILITAAHCVKGSHGWHTDFQFFNQYNGVHDKGSKIELDHLFAPGSFVSPTGDIDYR